MSSNEYCYTVLPDECYHIVRIPKLDVSLNTEESPICLVCGQKRLALHRQLNGDDAFLVCHNCKTIFNEETFFEFYHNKYFAKK